MIFSSFTYLFVCLFVGWFDHLTYIIGSVNGSETERCTIDILDPICTYVYFMSIRAHSDAPNGLQLRVEVEPLSGQYHCYCCYYSYNYKSHRIYTTLRRQLGRAHTQPNHALLLPKSPHTASLQVFEEQPKIFLHAANNNCI